MNTDLLALVGLLVIACILLVIQAHDRSKLLIRNEELRRGNQSLKRTQRELFKEIEHKDKSLGKYINNEFKNK